MIAPAERPEIEAQVARIVASSVFAKSERMSRFLRFVVDRTLEGRGGDLKEYSIALEVFDKDESFDPRIDPTVRSEARRLRAKLAEYYETAGAGDRILIDLPKGAYAPVFSERSQPKSKPKSTRRLYVAAALAAIVIVGAAAWWWLGHRKAGRTGSRSIAVLPFENLSADPANEYFADGLTEEILNALANVPGFKVAARTSAFQFKGKHEDIRSIGRKLSVDTVLEGSVRKEGDRIRITPQLINVADGYHLWSATYDREWKNLFDVQREIATDIVGVLGGKLGHAVPAPVDAETYRIYLEGRHHFDQWNPQGMLRAIQLFDQVVQRDPKYAPAYAGLSGAYGLLTAFGSAAVPPDVSRAKAKAAALKAIELDPNSSEGWASLAPKLVEELDWPSAESAFRKALELGPNSADAHAWYAELYLTPMGRLQEALRESQTAASLDPLSAYTMVGVGRRYYFLRQYDSAIAWYRKALDAEPGFNIAIGPLVNAYIAKGDRAGAEQFLEQSKALSPERLLALPRSHLLAAEANRAEALKILGEAKPGAGQACMVAAIQTALGEQKAAIAELNYALDVRSSCFTWIPVDPAFDRLRSNPDYAALLAKMKLSASH